MSAQSEEQAAQDFSELFNNAEELLPELQLYVEQTLGMTVLRHPLVYSVPHGPFFNKMVNARYRFMLERSRKMLAEGLYGEYVALHERPHRLDALLRVAEKMSDAEYWECLGWVYTDSENITQNRAEWRRALLSKRPDRYNLMCGEDRTTLAGLPDRVTAYRGFAGADQAAQGFSWTTERDRAVWFARRARCLNERRGMTSKVATVTVARTELIAYFGGRGESEVLLDPKGHNIAIEQA